MCVSLNTGDSAYHWKYCNCFELYSSPSPRHGSIQLNAIMIHIRMNLSYDILNSPMNRKHVFGGVIPLESRGCNQTAVPLNTVQPFMLEVDTSTLSSKLFSFGNRLVWGGFFFFSQRRLIVKLFSRLTAVQIVHIAMCAPSVVDLHLLGRQFVESFMRSFIGILCL